MSGVSVIIPSLPSRYAMLKEAVDSVRAQKVPGLEVEIIVALENNSPIPVEVMRDVEFIGNDNQSVKVNMGVQRARYPMIAILHDDDLWHPQFLSLALAEAVTADFVSSTALQTDEEGETIGIADCPVPSGWLFHKALFERVGGWSEDCRFHPDSEWLGRLGETANVRRTHLMDSLAPSPRIRIGGEWRYNQLASRPLFMTFLQQARPSPKIVRHTLPVPLVNHRQHGDGIMQRINEPERWMTSQWEYQRLIERFGRIPW